MRRWFVINCFRKIEREFPFATESSSTTYHALMNQFPHKFLIFARTHNFSSRWAVIFNNFDRQEGYEELDSAMDRIAEHIAFMIYPFPPQIGYISSAIFTRMMENWNTDFRATITLHIERRVLNFREMREKLDSVYYTDEKLVAEYHEFIFEYLKRGSMPLDLLRLAIKSEEATGTLRKERKIIEAALRENTSEVNSAPTEREEIIS